MLNKSINAVNTKPNKPVQSARKPMTPNSLYVGLPNGQRALQQQR